MRRLVATDPIINAKSSVALSLLPELFIRRVWVTNR